MGQTKGVGFTNVRAFVQDRFGADGWAALLASFPDADRAVLEGVVPVGWYDLALYARLIGAVDRRFGNGDLRLVRELGRFEAEKDLTTIHQFFLRLMNPSIVIEQTSKYWRRFHDTGEWETERIEDRGAVARLSGWAVVDAALCEELGAYLTRLLELCGCREVVMEHRTCRVRGDAVCELRARWRPRRDRSPAPPDEASGGPRRPRA
jgi:hypothetical protein